MNVLELCDLYSNYGSNFIPTLKTLETKLNNLGHNVYYVFSTRNLSKQFYEWESEFAKNHNTILLNFTKFSIINKTVEIIKKYNIKIVHAHFIASFFLSEIKRRCPKNVKFFEHIHSAPYNNKKTIKAHIKRIRNMVLLRHDIPKITVSNAIVPITKFIYPFTKVLACRNAIDFSRLEKRENNLKTDISILLFGYNYYIKGVDLAIEAATKIYKETKIHLDIVMGDNFEKNKKIILETYKQIPEFITLLEPTKNIKTLYKNHNILLNSSRTEGMSYANIEGYYSGLLCVFSDVPGSIETNLPGVFYFRNGDSNDLYKAIKASIIHINNYKNDLTYVEQNFSLENWCNQILKIFELI